MWDTQRKTLLTMFYMLLFCCVFQFSMVLIILCCSMLNITTIDTWPYLPSFLRLKRCDRYVWTRKNTSSSTRSSTRIRPCVCVCAFFFTFKDKFFFFFLFSAFYLMFSNNKRNQHKVLFHLWIENCVIESIFQMQCPIKFI